MSGIDHIDIELSIVIGSVEMSLKDAASLERGAVIRLAERPSDPLKVQANGVTVAHGQVALEGERVTVVVKDD
ncbi:MAG: FliM/FliN family flagellar motor C-terminal domain-containing protein [Pseudomonadota bacterium]